MTEAPFMEHDTTGLFSSMEEDDSVTVRLVLYKNGLQGAHITPSEDTNICYHVLYNLAQTFLMQIKEEIAELEADGNACHNKNDDGDYE